MTLIIPDLPKMPNQLLRRHWTTIMQEKKKWHRLVGLSVLQSRWDKAPLEKAQLKFTRYSTRQPDFDGLVSSFKYVTDGLVKAGVLVDDNLDIIGESTYKWEKCKRDEQRIEVEIG